MRLKEFYESQYMAVRRIYDRKFSKNALIQWSISMNTSRVIVPLFVGCVKCEDSSSCL